MTGTVLVVDDVATNRIILKAKLAIACYDVIQAADGPTALARAANDAPDLILLDLCMPGMTGIEVLYALKADATTRDIPVVVVSSQTDRRSRLAALSAGAEDFLAKPADDTLLSARVRALLRARLLTDELNLHDETRRALGFAEAQAPFAAPTALTPAGPDAGAPLQSTPAHGLCGPVTGIGAVAPMPAECIGLIDLSQRPGDNDLTQIFAGMPQQVARMTREDALRQARRPSPPPSGSPVAASPGPEAFVILPGPDTGHEAMMILSELRAGPGTCHAPILVALPDEACAQAAIALDLGVSDILPLPLCPDETALRLTRQLDRAGHANAARKQLRDGLQLAVTDALTGLPNRRYGLSHLERAFERALERDAPVSVLMLDLDRFKRVNDRYGHAAGDAVLRTVVARLLPQLRTGDLLARIGGEEFLVILPDVGASDAFEAATRLRRAVDAIPVALPPALGTAEHSASPRAGEQVVHQTVSVGLACGPAGAERDLARRAGLSAATAALLERADTALLRAKSSGRNCVIQEGPDTNDVAAA